MEKVLSHALRKYYCIFNCHIITMIFIIFHILGMKGIMFQATIPALSFHTALDTTWLSAFQNKSDDVSRHTQVFLNLQLYQILCRWYIQNRWNVTHIFILFYGRILLQSLYAGNCKISSNQFSVSAIAVSDVNCIDFTQCCRVLLLKLSLRKYWKAALQL